MNKFKVTWETKQSGEWDSNGAYFKTKKDALRFKGQLLRQKTKYQLTYIRNVQTTEL